MITFYGCNKILQPKVPWGRKDSFGFSLQFIIRVKKPKQRQKPGGRN